MTTEHSEAALAAAKDITNHCGRQLADLLEKIKVKRWAVTWPSGDRETIASIIEKHIPPDAGWVAVTEKLPLNDRMVLVHCSGNTIQAHWVFHKDKWCAPLGFVLVGNVTYWRPLPEPPAIS